MTPDEYNRLQMLGGHVAPEHVTEMTRIVQAQLKLAVDGKCGPATRASLEAHTRPALPRRPAPPASIGEAVVAFAVTLIGQGEEGANNRGSFIEKIGGGAWAQGMEWCALSGGYAWRETLRRAGKTPASYWFRQPRGRPEPGALNLIRAIAAASAAAGGPGRFKDPMLARPGDVAALDHGDGHGHFMLVERPDPDGLTHLLEGNVGRYPAKYKRMVRDLPREPRFWGFARPPVCRVTLFVTLMASRPETLRSETKFP